MALDGWMSLAGVEIINTARLQAYLSGVDEQQDPSGLTSWSPCGCDSLTAGFVGDDDYMAPDLDPAPWWDPNVPESAEFLGLMVLSVLGVDDRPTARTVTQGVAGAAALGRLRTQPRSITVTAVLVGASCCGVEYGLRWLGEALTGCGGRRCGGDDLVVYSCCPTDPPDDPDEVWRRYGRTMRRVALVQGPTVLSRVGDGCGGGGCGGGSADVVTVEWVMTAAVPWLWTPPDTVLQVPVPRNGSDDCVTWCVHDAAAPPPPPPICVELVDDCPSGGVEFGCEDCPPGSLQWPDDQLCPGQEPPDPPPCSLPCRLAVCPDPTAACQDPGCRTPTPPSAPPPDTCFCSAIAVETECHEIDLTGRPAGFASAPVITIDAGSADLRRLTIAIYQRRPEHDGMTCDEVAAAERCDPHSVYEVGYVPAGGVLRLDGQTGRATVWCDGVLVDDCEPGGETAADVWGRDGGPLPWRLLDPDVWCVCLSTDAIVPPATDATIEIAVSGREY